MTIRVLCGNAAEAPGIASNLKKFIFCYNPLMIRETHQEERWIPSTQSPGWYSSSRNSSQNLGFLCRKQFNKLFVSFPGSFSQLNCFVIPSHFHWWRGKESCWKGRQAQGERKETVTRNCNPTAQIQSKHDKQRGWHPSSVIQPSGWGRWGRGGKTGWVSAPKHLNGCCWPLQSPSWSPCLFSPLFCTSPETSSIAQGPTRVSCEEYSSCCDIPHGGTIRLVWLIRHGSVIYCAECLLKSD